MDSRTSSVVDIASAHDEGMSVRRESPRPMTEFPGGAPLVRLRLPPRRNQRRQVHAEWSLTLNRPRGADEGQASYVADPGRRKPVATL